MLISRCVPESAAVSLEFELRGSKIVSLADETSWSTDPIVPSPNMAGWIWAHTRRVIWNGGYPSPMAPSVSAVNWHTKQAEFALVNRFITENTVAGFMIIGGSCKHHVR
jgi:hypothetical protein